ncbi:hypothetical protein AgCh_021985 [Apium graveolens]
MENKSLSLQQIMNLNLLAAYTSAVGEAKLVNDASKWEEAANMRELMKTCRVIKQPGYSLIRLNMWYFSSFSESQSHY